MAAANDIITEPVAPLSAEQEQFLREKPNYQGLLDELKSFREQALLAVRSCIFPCSPMAQFIKVISLDKTNSATEYLLVDALSNDDTAKICRWPIRVNDIKQSI